LSQYTGDYWINEFEDNIPKVAGLTLQERTLYYAEIILHCKLDTSNAVIFFESLGADEKPLAAQLGAIKSLSWLTAAQRSEVVHWQSLLEVE
jgi:tryptophanyl-tRNA synthetase